jgi:hypothetical protein
MNTATNMVFSSASRKMVVAGATYEPTHRDLGGCSLQKLRVDNPIISPQ